MGETHGAPAFLSEAERWIGVAETDRFATHAKISSQFNLTQADIQEGIMREDTASQSPDVLTARLEALEAKVEQLEHGRKMDKIRRLWLGGLCAVLGCTVIGVNAKAAPKVAAAAKPAILTCTELKVVGTDGKPRVDIGDNTIDHGYIVTQDKAGNQLVKLTTDANGKGDVEVFGSDDKARVEFGVNTTNSGYEATYGANGNVRTRISTDTADNGGLELMSTDGKDRLWTGVNPTGSGFISSFGTNGNARFRLSTDTSDLPAIELMGADGKDRVFEDVNTVGSGQIETLGADGNLRTQLTSDAADAGCENITGTNNKVRVYLGSNPKTNIGMAQFDDQTGTVKKELP
jgi:hypothetical protein